MQVVKRTSQIHSISSENHGKTKQQAEIEWRRGGIALTEQRRNADKNNSERESKGGNIEVITETWKNQKEREEVL